MKILTLFSVLFVVQAIALPEVYNQSLDVSKKRELNNHPETSSKAEFVNKHRNKRYRPGRYKQKTPGQIQVQKPNQNLQMIPQKTGDSQGHPQTTTDFPILPQQTPESKVEQSQDLKIEQNQDLNHEQSQDLGQNLTNGSEQDQGQGADDEIIMSPIVAYYDNSDILIVDGVTAFRDYDQCINVAGSEKFKFSSDNSKICVCNKNAVEGSVCSDEK